MIWATRGKTWGFRFLRDAGLADPLPEYERVFATVAPGPRVWERVDGAVALRFPDPEGRRDASGRTIPHSFVLFDRDAERISSADEGIDRVWPLVKDDYASLWAQPDSGQAGADR